LHASVRLDHTLLALEGEREVHAMLELAAPEAPTSDERAPLSLALVLDRSGSMAGPKLETAKACAAWVVSRLHGQDRLALVDFDDEVRLLTPLLPIVTGTHPRALGLVRAGGSTNLSGGWLKALEQLGPAPREHARKIVLLTDGLANVGVTDSSLARGDGAAGSGAGHRDDDDRARRRLRRRPPHGHGRCRRGQCALRAHALTPPPRSSPRSSRG
jgi:Ca-activated chloride channel family protein